MERTALDREVQRYLRTGETDPCHFAWSGDVLTRARRAHYDLRTALARAVAERTQGLRALDLPQLDARALTRAKAEPMVRGLFPAAERAPVLAALETSVIILTSANIEEVLFGCSFDGEAWTLANLYLAAVGAPLLSETAPRLVGLSQETTCYLTPEYFAESDPFADFLVHEVAHLFHNCKRAGVGLRETRRKEWLLDIEFRKRETFAYACEAYSRVLERGKSAARRRALAGEYAARAAPLIADERVDPAEVAAIVCEAASARNGWRVILARCRERRGIR